MLEENTVIVMEKEASSLVIPHIRCIIHYSAKCSEQFIHSFNLFSIYPYTGRIPRMWKLSDLSACLKVLHPVILI